MPLLADRVKESTTTIGTGTVALAGAPAGFQSFNAAFANGATVYYVIQGGAEYEIGIGTVGTGTLARTTVLQSSNADALVPFSAGVKDVFCSYVADRAVTTVDAATLTNKVIDSITNLVGADHLHYKIKANATIAKGQTLKVVGYNSGDQAIEVVPVSSASDVAVGIAYQALNTGEFGAAINTGLLTNIKTDYAGWALGDILYPDPATGGLTKTKPASGTYQACAYVMRVQANNGVLLCEFTEPAPVTASTNTANTVVARDGSGNFAAGTITASLTGSISGNAATATALQTARLINGVSFNGTADITVAAAAGTLTGSTLASGVTASSLTSVGTLSSLTVSGNTIITGGSLQTRNGIITYIWNSNTTNYASLQNVGAPGAGNALLQIATDSGASMYLNAAGNVGIGVTPSAWTSSNYRVLETAGGFFGNYTSGVVLVGQNYYDSSVGSFLYKNNGFASYYSQANGQHRFYNAPSGTAGAAISFTQAMTLDASGNLGLNVTPSASWSAGFRALQIANQGMSLSTSTSSNDTYLNNNGVYNGTNWLYQNSAAAAQYRQVNADHRWFTAPSGTAGNTITFTERMRVDATTTAGQTALLLWDVDNGTLERVTVGAADSGGTGFKVLRIPN